MDDNCIFPGCDRSWGSYTRLKLCGTHYQQKRRGVELRPIKAASRAGDDTCIFPGCDRSFGSRGRIKLCGGHYQQQRRGEELKPLRTTTPRTTEDGRCSFPGCDRSWGGYSVLKLCPGHYQQKQQGRELKPLKGSGPTTGTCIFEGCGRSRGPYTNLKLCSGHYMQHWRGRPLTPIVKGRPWTLDRILATAVRDGECWNWKRKYGTVSHEGKVLGVHVLAYRLSTGDFTPGRPIHHKCANALCVNPAHLEAASDVDNTLEMFARRDYEAQIAALKARVEELEAR